MLRNENQETDQKVTTKGSNKVKKVRHYRQGFHRVAVIYLANKKNQEYVTAFTDFTDIHAAKRCHKELLLSHPNATIEFVSNRKNGWD